MKVSVDGIISTARRMKGQKQVDDESFKKKNKSIGSDSIEIKKKINSRLLVIQNELNSIQSSLTKNQIIKEGINQLIDDKANGGTKTEFILNEFKFEDQRVVSEFVGDDIDDKNLNIKFNMANKLIRDDTSNLKRLQIEVENILASNLADSELQDIINDIESIASRINSNSLTNITELNPEMVLNLIN